MPVRTSLALAVASFVLALAPLECGGQGLVRAPQYTLIIDAGSSGSRLRMYNKTSVGVTEIHPREEDEDDFETEPGVSSYTETPGDAGPSLDGLLEAAAKYIPEDLRSQTPVWVKATAGMRLVPREQLSSLFDAMDKHLSKGSTNPFKYMGSEVLGGEEEAVFAWISMNFILGTIFDGYTKTSGIMDMGGASMQVAFNPGQDIMSNEFSFYVKRNRMSVYAKSFIQFGLTTAVRRAMKVVASNTTARWARVEFPCFNKGYSEYAKIGGKHINFTGTGDPTACDAIARGLLHEDYECLLEPCSLMGVHMPKVMSWKKYYGLANFFYIANGLGLIGWGETKALQPKAIFDATQKFCGLSLEDAKAHSGAPWKYKKSHCFGGLFMYRILKAYGFEDTAAHIVFARKLNGQSADWSMGAALYETQYMPLSLQSRDTDSERAAQQKWAAAKPRSMPLQLFGTPVWLGALAAVSGLAWLGGRRLWSSARGEREMLMEGVDSEVN